MHYGLCTVQPKCLWATNTLFGCGRTDPVQDPLTFMADDYLTSFTVKVLDIQKVQRPRLHISFGLSGALLFWLSSFFGEHTS